MQTVNHFKEMVSAKRKLFFSGQTANTNTKSFLKKCSLNFSAYSYKALLKTFWVLQQLPTTGIRMEANNRILACLKDVSYVWH